MAKAYFLQDKEGNKVYPYTHADATFDRDGNKVGDRLDNMDGNIDDKMNKENPEGIGSLSLNRKSGTMIGNNSVAVGENTVASGIASFAEGGSCQATGDYSHAEGCNSGDTKVTASGIGSHAEGRGTNTGTNGSGAHAEGVRTTANNEGSHSEGVDTESTGIGSHAEGQNTVANNWTAHAEGRNTRATASSSHAEGLQSEATNGSAHAEGYNTRANGDCSHAEGSTTKAIGSAAHAEGYMVEAVGQRSHGEGCETQANGDYSHSEGNFTKAIGVSAHAEGKRTQATGEGAHAEGYYKRGVYLEIVEGQTGYRLLDQNKTPLPNWLNGYYWDAGEESAIELGSYPLRGLCLYSVDDGTTLKATVEKTYTVFNEGNYDLYAILDTDLSAEITSNPDKGYYMYYGKSAGQGSHSEGGGIALGTNSHAEGSATWAAHQAHAEGFMSAAMNTGSHAEGIKNAAYGQGSHAEGNYSKALGNYSHTEGVGTISTSIAQHVQGKYNVKDDENKYAHIVGNGTSEEDRKNIHTLDWNGNAEYAGDVTATKEDGTKVSLIEIENDYLKSEDKEVLKSLINTAKNSAISTASSDATKKSTEALEDSKAYTDTRINSIIGEGASETLDTIGEISQAFEEHEEVTEVLNAAIGNKADKTDLQNHISNTVHVTPQERTDWNDANDKKHSHSNEGVLDNTTASFTTEEKAKLSNIEASANKYVLPNAGEHLGGIKSGGDLTIVDGIATVNDDSHNHVIENIDGLQELLNENLLESIEFTKTTSITTARGNAILENLKGDSYQKRLSGQNLYNVHDYTNVNAYQNVDSDDWITIDYDNTAGTGDVYINHFTKPSKLLKANTSYAIVCEVKEISGGTLSVFNNDSNGGQFTESYSVTKIGTHVKVAMSKETVTGAFSMLRTFFYVGKGKAQKIVFRISVMEDVSVTADTFMYEPYCGGIPSPNTDYPQDIRSVGDTGWFDGELMQGGYYKDDGIYLSSALMICNKNTIPCITGDVVKVIYDNASINDIDVAWYNDDGFISYSWDEPFVAPGSATYFNFNISFTDNVIPSCEDIGRVAVTINGKYALIVDESNDNLFGGLAFANALVQSGATASISKSNKVVSFGGDSNSSKFSYANFKENTRYTFFARGYNDDTRYPTFTNFRILYTDNTFDEFHFITDATKQQVLVSKSGKTVLKLQGFYASGVAHFYYEDFGIMEGVHTLEDFIPHQSSRYYIPLDEPLRGIGDVEDEVLPQDGLYGEYRPINKVVFDGNESGWYAVTATPNLYAIPTNDMSPDTVNVRCSHYKYKYANENGCVYASRRILAFCDTTCASLDEFIAKVQANPITVHYELAEPVFTPFEDQTPFYNFKSYEEVTHISIIGCHEELNPMATIRFPRNEDGAMVTTNWCDINLHKIETDIKFNELAKESHELTDEEIEAIWHEVFQ